MSKLGLIDVIKSVIAAGIGIQSKKNRELDFEHGSLSQYLIVGLIATLLFIITIVFIVSTVTN
ncbi:MAG: DUF2970 domain-containing protein [Methylococcaceae bacterium]|nr:DUF2970 domain-containing protein [Methylococcaceae bacterium]